MKSLDDQWRHERRIAQKFRANRRKKRVMYYLGWFTEDYYESEERYCRLDIPFVRFEKSTKLRPLSFRCPSDPWYYGIKYHRKLKRLRRESGILDSGILDSSISINDNDSKINYLSDMIMARACLDPLTAYRDGYCIGVRDHEHMECVFRDGPGDFLPDEVWFAFRKIPDSLFAAASQGHLWEVLNDSRINTERRKYWSNYRDGLRKLHRTRY